MQTKDMKKDYEVAVLDPAGNVTAIVLSDVPAAERARVAARLLRLPELHIEQAAFLTAPRCGGEIRLEMMGGEFCGNALRCAGFYHALRTGAQGKTCVFAEISGAEGVQPVMADTAAGEASTVMPLPRAVQPVEWPDVPAVRVTFAGITHFVIDRAQPDDALVQRAIAAAPEASAVGAVFLDRAAGSIRPGKSTHLHRQLFTVLSYRTIGIRSQHTDIQMGAEFFQTAVKPRQQLAVHSNSAVIVKHQMMQLQNISAGYINANHKFSLF